MLQTTARHPQIRAALEDGITNHTHLLACFDFDGTLAPIVDEPAAANILPRIQQSLCALENHEEVTTALVSGRALADLRSRVDGVSALAGNHGLEVTTNGTAAIHPLAARRQSLMDHCCDRLEQRLEGINGCWVENKAITATVHCRHVSNEARPRVASIVERVVDDVGEGRLECRGGKSILEIEPHIPWSKGHAVSLLEAKIDADTFVLYVGDDVTDESAFAQVEPAGLGIAVGTDGGTGASHSVESPQDVRHLLEWLNAHLAMVR